MRLALLLLFATSASAQDGNPTRLLATFSLGSATDSLGGMLAVQAGAGIRRGIASARVRGTRAENVSIGFSTENRMRWEVAALGGVTVGDKASLFVGAGPGLTGGGVDRGCFLSSVCPDEALQPTLGLGLAFDATARVSSVVRVGLQVWANVNRTRSVGGTGFLLQVGG